VRRGEAGVKQLEMAVSEIRRGQHRPVYLVHGEEPWLVFRVRRGLVEAFEALGASVARFEGDAAYEQVLGELSSLSLFAERRTILWTGCPYLARGSGEAGRRRFLEALDGPLDENATLIVACEKVDRQSKLYRRIAALGVEIECPALKSYGLGQPGRDEAWPHVQAYLAAQGKQMRPDAFAELRSRTEPDLWTLMGELDRLIAYIGEAPGIELEDVRELVAPSRTDLVFELVDAVGAKNVRQALELLGRLAATGAKDFAVLGALTQSTLQVREARALMDGPVSWRRGMDYNTFKGPFLASLKRAVPDSSLAAMHPFPAFKRFQSAASFQPQELDALLQGLADIDLAVKSSAEDGYRALQMFLASRLSGRTSA
jgi:DNA polymerase III subunit delta